LAQEHRTLSLDEVRKRLGSEGGDPFVVGAELIGGRLIGTAGFYREQNLKTGHKGRIWGVYMTPARRGTGVGKRMLQTILKRVEEM
jgi:GNAT superfamily N-acetyltransferase